MQDARVGAVAVWGEEFDTRQPDGTPIKVRIWGDEFYRILESLDGYTLISDASRRALCFSDLAPGANLLISTGIPAEMAPPRGLSKHLRVRGEVVTDKVAGLRAAAQSPFFIRWEDLKAANEQTSARGDLLALTLLVDFVDEQATVSPAEIDDFCNQTGYSHNGNNGSVHDYFYDVSGGALNYHNFVVENYYRAKYPKAYYCDPTAEFGVRAHELVREALAALDEGGFDFTLVDPEANGYVYVNILYAGLPCVYSMNGLWPHTSAISFTADGVDAGTYQMTDIGDFPTLGTFCHENGHLLFGWRDLYDYGFDSWGVGYYCIMSYGTSDTNPQEPCAVYKAKEQWPTVLDLQDPSVSLSLPSASSLVYMYSKPDPIYCSEYYIIENMQKSGRNIDLPDAGMAIWHVDWNVTNGNNYQEMLPDYHYTVTLVQADGRWDLEHGSNLGDDSDLWSAPDYTNFTPETLPNSHWWDGSCSNINFFDISGSSSTMTFSYRYRCNVPSSCMLFGSYPNPCKLPVTITYALPQVQQVRLMLYDLGGRPVRLLLDEVCPIGKQGVEWDGMDDHGQPVASGVYLCRMETESVLQSHCLTLIK